MQNLATMQWDDSYARDLPGAYVAAKPAPVGRPRLVFWNEALAQALGWDEAAMGLRLEDREQVFTGQVIPPGARPIAQAYAGHQFGGFSPQLGDGRALLLGEVIDPQGRRHDLAFKGSGRTVFSRGGDGLAALGPMLREALMGEAMHALGVPTTRALAVAATGDWVQRDRALPGAVLTRVADSHIRVGTFEFFAARGDQTRLQALLNHAVARHAPAAAHAPIPALALLESVVQRQCALVALWMNLGFIHGVMNTDNMTISGQTIDYGPCAFMESYSLDTVFSSIDRQGRYAYGQQPTITQWNLARLAETLLPLMHTDTEAAIALALPVIESVPQRLEAAMWQGWRRKLGLVAEASALGVQGAGLASSAVQVADTLVFPTEAERQLLNDWWALLEADGLDFTLAWRHLADVLEGSGSLPWRTEAGRQGGRAWEQRWQQALLSAAHSEGLVSGEARDAPSSAHEWAARQELMPWRAQRAAAMRRVSPLVIPRNHRMEAVLQAATEGEFQALHDWVEVLRRPFDDGAPQVDVEPAHPTEAARHRTFCGT